MRHHFRPTSSIAFGSYRPAIWCVAQSRPPAVSWSNWIKNIIGAVALGLHQTAQLVSQELPCIILRKCHEINLVDISVEFWRHTLRVHLQKSISNWHRPTPLCIMQELKSKFHCMGIRISNLTCKWKQCNGLLPTYLRTVDERPARRLGRRAGVGVQLTA